jgi:hypothetical protein
MVMRNCCFWVAVGSLVAAGAANAADLGDSLVREHYFLPFFSKELVLSVVKLWLRNG